MRYKSALIYFTFALTISGFSQTTSFELNGKVKWIEDGIVSIFIPESDSSSTISENDVQLRNGKFSLKGKLAFPRLVLLYIDSQNTKYGSGWFFIEPGLQFLSVDVINENLRISSNGNTFNEEFKYKIVIDSLDKIVVDITRKLDSISSIPDINNYQKITDSLLELKTNFQKNKNAFLLQYIKLNPDSYVGLSQLKYFIYKNGYSPVYDSAYLSLDRELKLKPDGREIFQMLENTRHFKIGSKFPPIQLWDTGSTKIYLNQIKLKEYTLLDFWYHSCGPCIFQFPKLNETYIKWRNKGFEIIGISSDKIRYDKEWKKAIQKNNLLWPQFWDKDGLQSTELLINFFPTNFLIDKSGNIIAKNIDLKDLDKFLETKLR